MIVVQCAGRKQPHAGHKRTQDGQRVCFVVDPAKAPAGDCLYARPDDPSDAGPILRIDRAGREAALNARWCAKLSRCSAH